MYFYNANKSHLNKHPSRAKVLDDFVNSKSMHLDGFMENEHVWVCMYVIQFLQNILTLFWCNIHTLIQTHI